MRLIKQSTLYFKEGNSDKVYEIDLCDAGNDRFVVNFRYGRKGAQLKEGSKTPIPVSLAEAEKIYSAIQDEKLGKGYTASESGVSSVPRAPAFTLHENNTGVILNGWEALPHGPDRAILQRLQNAITGQAGKARTAWKLSRVIWKAGEYKITAAAPYIIKLFNKGDTLHQYCCAWALARCGGSTSVDALQTLYRDHPSPLVRKMAGAGLLKLLSGPEKQQHLAHYLQQLPEAMKAAVNASDGYALDILLDERIQQKQPQYNWVESLYLLSTEILWLRPPVKMLLTRLPFRPAYFRHIRAVFKLAELLDDFEISGLLACRTEREKEFYEHSLRAQDTSTELYIENIDEHINPHRELQKKNSRLAYSQKTRWYLHRRVQRKLEMLGRNSNTDYVRLATAILIAYDKALDFKEAFSTTSYKWTGRSYNPFETRFLQNAQAIYLHQLISGLNPDLTVTNAHLWRVKGPEPKRTSPQNPTRIFNPNNNDLDIIAGFFKKLFRFFSKPTIAQVTTPAHRQEKKPTPAPSAGGTPYLHLWNELPQSYVQLLAEGRLDEIHQFALANLSIHPSFADIRQRLDTAVCKKLLLSSFALPAEFGYTVVLERYIEHPPAPDLVAAMLNSRHNEARHKGKQWTENNAQQWLEQADFVTTLLFATFPDTRSWAKELLRNHPPSPAAGQAITGKCIAEMMCLRQQTPENEAVINSVSDTLFELFLPGQEEMQLAVIADLLQHPAPAVLLFGLRLLKARKHDFEPAALSKSFLFGLLQHPYAPVRATGLSFVESIDAGVLLQYRDEMTACCICPWTDVRQGIRPAIARMAQKERAFGEVTAAFLMPCLLRKETSDGLHNDIGNLLCNELSDYLQNANKETALRLLYGNYTAAQNVGVTILEKYTDPSQLTLPQVIALGNHENLEVRSWCWNFYRRQVARIKYERDASIKLLDSKWSDTQQFAIQYFREQFSESDWSPETLITLADSVKPEVEAFARELITRYFDSGNGVEYLLKLSQHPSQKMQLFVTNYLERYAGGHPGRIESLEFYFRSVLSAVNKNRIAKNRIYRFLLEEGRQSEATATVVVAILTDVSATAAIGDKAACIEILLQLQSVYKLATPLKVNPVETRA